jgi:hypothetical protein
MISLNPEDQHCCAVCGLMLDLFEPASQRLPSAWVHPTQDLPEDHPAVPVRVADLPSIRSHCDFCSADAPRWIVPARSFTEPFLPGATLAGSSVGAWAACDVCVDYIRLDRWNALQKRVLSLLGSNELAMAERALSKLYRLLRSSITGSPERIRQSPSAPDSPQ